jgi:hypothetical protein
MTLWPAAAATTARVLVPPPSTPTTSPGALKAARRAGRSLTAARLGFMRGMIGAGGPSDARTAPRLEKS